MRATRCGDGPRGLIIDGKPCRPRRGVLPAPRRLGGRPLPRPYRARRLLRRGTPHHRHRPRQAHFEQGDVAPTSGRFRPGISAEHRPPGHRDRRRDAGSSLGRDRSARRPARAASRSVQVHPHPGQRRVLLAQWLVVLAGPGGSGFRRPDDRGAAALGHARGRSEPCRRVRHARFVGEGRASRRHCRRRARRAVRRGGGGRRERDRGPLRAAVVADAAERARPRSARVAPLHPGAAGRSITMRFNRACARPGRSGIRPSPWA